MAEIPSAFSSASVPQVNEVGLTSAPLKSAAFFIGAYCKEYNEDFVLCKNESRDPAHCLKEGRKVTRCTIDLITKMRENCAKQFDAHWDCLEKKNHVCHIFRCPDCKATHSYRSATITVHNEACSQEYYMCRKPERTLNTCMFEKLGLTKTIPGSPPGQTPIHEVENPVYKAVQK